MPEHDASLRAESESRTGHARVYFWPEPERGAHPGLRGEITVDAIGVHTTVDTEYLIVDNESATEGWPMGEWDPSENEDTIPWHRIHSITWLSPGEIDGHA